MVVDGGRQGERGHGVSVLLHEVVFGREDSAAIGKILVVCQVVSAFIYLWFMLICFVLVGVVRRVFDDSHSGLIEAREHIDL